MGSLGSCRVDLGFIVLNWVLGSGLGRKCMLGFLAILKLELGHASLDPERRISIGVSIIKPSVLPLEVPMLVCGV